MAVVKAGEDALEFVLEFHGERSLIRRFRDNDRRAVYVFRLLGYFVEKGWVKPKGWSECLREYEVVDKKDVVEKAFSFFVNADVKSVRVVAKLLDFLDPEDFLKLPDVKPSR